MDYKSLILKIEAIKDHILYKGCKWEMLSSLILKVNKIVVETLPSP